MSLDLIKSFMVGLGFDIDQQSFEKANKYIDNAGKKIKEFNDNSNEGFSETNNSLKDLFSLLNSSHTLGSLFPGLKKPLKGLLLDLKSVKDYYDKLSRDKNKDKDFVSKKEIVKDKINETVKNVAKETVKVKETVKDVVNKNVVNNTTETFKDTINETIKDIYKVKEYVKDIVNERVINKTQENIKNTRNKNVEHTKSENIIERIKETEIIKNKKLANKKDVPKLKDSVSYTEVTPVVDIRKLNDMKENIKAIGAASENTGLMIGGFREGLGSLASAGGTSLKAFSATSVAGLAVVAGAIVGAITLITAFITAIKKLSSYLNKLAEKDIQYEKLSRMLWTTKQTAQEVSQALDVLGASMEDLWLSPTLLKQFNELRKDASQIRLPDEFQDNLKLVQDLGFEFKRMKQLAGMLFQWIGHYILEYLKGPLGEFKGDMQDFNSWLIDNIPKIAKGVGTTIGMFLKFMIVLGKFLALLWKLGSPVWKLIEAFMKIGEWFDKLPTKANKSIRSVVLALAFLLNPLLLALALLEDFFVFMRGGKSVIGDVVEFFSQKWEEAIDRLLDKFPILGRVIKFITRNDNSWKEYKEEAEENASLIGFAFEKLKEKFKKGFSPNRKEWSTYAGVVKDDIEDMDELIKNAKISKQGFSLPDMDFKQCLDKTNKFFMYLKDKWDSFKKALKRDDTSIGIEVGNIDTTHAIKSLDNLLDTVKSFKDSLNKSLSSDNEWTNYYAQGKEALNKLKEKSQEVFGDMKDLSKNLFENKDNIIKNGIGNVLKFEQSYGAAGSSNIMNSYMTKNSNSIRTTNNNNEVSNKNVINVYSNDAHQTGSVINKRLTGITSRNLTGAIE